MRVPTGLGLIACVGLALRIVFFPLAANIIAFVASLPGVEPKSQATILEWAADIDKCSTRILDKTGDAWILAREPVRATYAFGRAMACSPASALFRFKYGEAMIMTGYPEGVYHVLESVKLEPNNPYYTAEANRLKALQVR